jgi:hypothetical protein
MNPLIALFAAHKADSNGGGETGVVQVQPPQERSRKLPPNPGRMAITPVTDL